MQGDSTGPCACGCGGALPAWTPRADRQPPRFIKGHVHKNSNPWVVCEGCGVRFACAERARRFCSRACCGRHRKGQRHPNFKGRVAQKGGYIRVYRPGHPLAHKDGYVLEHRLIAYEAGLLTDPTHEVHHHNRARDDNRPENLEPLPPAEHLRRHRRADDPVVNQYGTFRVKGSPD